jgi:hypothetical protein
VAALGNRIDDLEPYVVPGAAVLPAWIAEPNYEF